MNDLAKKVLEQLNIKPADPKPDLEFKNPSYKVELQTNYDPIQIKMEITSREIVYNDTIIPGKTPKKIRIYFDFE